MNTQAHKSRCDCNPVSFLVTLSLAFAFVATSAVAGEWPQAAGPNHDYRVDGTGPAAFSVTRNQRVLWRTALPNTGESTPIVAGGRVFLTCHTPITSDAESGLNTLAMCFDAQTGRELWRRTLPSMRVTDMASGFSDNTAASPVTDGQFVCFVNVGGLVSTFDFDGELIWQHDWIPFGRHHARQQEPILHDGKVIFLKTVATDLPLTATTKAGAKPLGRDRSLWTHLHAFDLATGKLEWVAESATSVHSASLLNRTHEGKTAILTGRGGGHQPPEEPYGLSLVDADTGQTIWDLPIGGYEAHQNAVWRSDQGAAFVGLQHHLIDVIHGKLGPAVSLTENVFLRSRVDGRYVSLPNTDLPHRKRRKATTYHTNCLAGDFHYFRTHSDHFIGRVHLPTGKVEYLQVPVQVVRDSATETVLWETALENDAKNSDGFIVCQDRRAKLSGWGHVSAASPIVVGEHLYMPTMIGIVYVIRWDAPQLDESALVSISDLGPATKTWTLSSLAFADGKLYARTMKELICIGDE